MPHRILMIILVGLLLVTPSSILAKEAEKARNISALEAMQMLRQEPKTTFLIDVRTRAEYSLLGHAPGAYNIPLRFSTTDFQVKDRPYNGNNASFTGYQLSSEINPDFVGVVKSLFKPEDRIIVISTQGDQGAQAADMLALADFKHVFNIVHGFLGQKLVSKNQDNLAEKYSPYWGRRARVNGWAYWGLPISYSVDPKYVYPPDLKKMQSLK